MGDNRVLPQLISYTPGLRKMSEDLPFDTEQNGLNKEINRLKTFNNWPSNAPVAKEKLAKAGFYYFGPENVVKCFSCGVTVSNWEYNDQVSRKHSILNPNCDFVKNKSNNIPYIQPSNGSPMAAIQSSRSSGAANRNSNFGFPSNVSLLNGGISISTADEKIWSSFAVLRSESERLKTFKRWPCPFIQPEDLAKAGFFFLKEGDKVQCFFCKGIVGEWERDDIPINEHRRHFPHCLFIKGIDVGNIPIRENGNENQLPQEYSQMPSTDDVAGRYQYEMENFSGPEKGHINALNLEQYPYLGGIGITEHRGPKHPNYATMDARLRSFDRWPDSIPQRPQDLAVAGFYYAGVSDHVRCFHCDGGLRNWEATDDPWIEHARWFGNCSFVLLVKGHEFITQVKLRHPPSLNLSSSNEMPSVKKVTIEEINSLLNSPIVKTVLECGVTLPVIRYALQKQILSVGEPFANPDTLYEACLHAEQELRQSSSLPHGGNGEMQSRSTVTHEEPCVSNRNIVNEGMTTSVSSPNIQGSFKDITQKTQELSLAEENQRLKELQLCKICMDEEVGIVFLPCGHLISCPKCAPSITDCPMCRKPITHTVRTYLS